LGEFGLVAYRQIYDFWNNVNSFNRAICIALHLIKIPYCSILNLVLKSVITLFI